MNRARIVGLCTLAAGGYGVVHDQITVRICLEYLSVAHPPLFPTQSPTLLALCWGIAATIFIGLAFGVVLAAIAHAGPQPPLPATCLFKPLVVLLAVMGISAFIAGTAGYSLTRAGAIPVPEAVAKIIPAARRARFMAVWFAHLASYVVGLTGAALVCLRTWRARGRPAAIALWPQDRLAVLRTVAIVAVGAALYWWRFHAR